MNFLQQIVKYVIRPTRDMYHPQRLGPTAFEVRSVLTGYYNSIRRIDQRVLHHNTNQYIEISYFINEGARREDCVIYLHANNGSRVQGMAYLQKILQNDMNLCLFDFRGSGLSDGEYVTLGLNESEDVATVVRYLHKFQVQNVVLWGRSMGAVTAIIYSNKFKGVAGVILDSPFKDLRKLIKQLASERTGLPKFLFQPVLSLVESQIIQKTGKNILGLKVKHYMSKQSLSDVPSLFIVSKNDKMVKPHHCEKLYIRYPSELKQIQYIDIQHHEVRQNTIIKKCIQFCQISFQNNRKKSIRNKIKLSQVNKISQINKVSQINKISKVSQVSNIKGSQILPNKSNNFNSPSKQINNQELKINNSHEINRLCGCYKNQSKGRQIFIDQVEGLYYSINNRKSPARTHRQFNQTQSIYQKANKQDSSLTEPPICDKYESLEIQYYAQPHTPKNGQNNKVSLKGITPTVRHLKKQQDFIKRDGSIQLLGKQQNNFAYNKKNKISIANLKS